MAFVCLYFPYPSCNKFHKIQIEINCYWIIFKYISMPFLRKMSSCIVIPLKKKKTKLNHERIHINNIFFSHKRHNFYPKHFLLWIIIIIIIIIYNNQDIKIYNNQDIKIKRDTLYIYFSSSETNRSTN